MFTRLNPRLDRISSTCLAIGLIVAIALSGCGPTPEQIAAQTATAETATAASWTATPTRTATASATATATATATETPTPTDTATPRATATSSATATLTPTRTLPPPTATETPTPSPVPQAPLFPGTQMAAWSTDDFRYQVREGRINMERFLVYFRDHMVEAGMQGRCYNIYPHYEEVISKRVGYSSGVPDDWYGLYYEYRVVLQDAAAQMAPVAALCRPGDATLTGDQARAIVANLEGIYLHAVDLEARVNAKP